jgi:hypothetical protein
VKRLEMAPDAKVIGYVFEQDALWFRAKRRGSSWHLTRPSRIRSWCGRDLKPGDDCRTVHVTWPWPSRSCWSCMDRRWSKGVR